MTKTTIAAIIMLMLIPLVGFSAFLSDEEKAALQQEAVNKQQDLSQQGAEAKQNTAEAINKNLGTILTPEQQKQAFSKIFAGLDKVLDEVEEEIKGSPNIPAEEKQKILDSLSKVAVNLDTCEAGVAAAATQTELNAAYQQCVNNIKKTINNFMNTVYDVAYEMINEYIKVAQTFLNTTQMNLDTLKTCETISSADITELEKMLSDANKTLTELKAHYDATVNLDYTRPNLVKAMTLTAKLTAYMSRLYEEYEDQYYIYVDSCGKGLTELDNPYEDLKQETADEISDQAEDYKDKVDTAKNLAE